jgi:methylated-DNA-[protein]-cysteine S-methyltransferase
MKAKNVNYTVVDSPIGELMLTSDGSALTGLYMEAHKGGPKIDRTWKRDDAAFGAVKAELDAYFAGESGEFRSPIAFVGTEFQKRVWHALRKIPRGQTMSYAELARQIGSPRAVRAVGAAVGKNPVSVIVPCHRVVGSNGSLTGFAGGVERKQWLLDHERAMSSGKKQKTGNARLVSGGVKS